MSLPQPKKRQPPPEPDLLGYYAGFISRFLAFLLDTVVISFTIAATTWFVSITTSAFRLGAFLGISPENIPWTRPILDIISGPLVTGLISAAFIVSYFVFFWVFAGQTPGKAFLGLRLVTTTGQRVSPLRAILRFAAYFISGIPLAFGFLWVLADDRRQAWHDKIAGTCVIYTWAARPDELFLKEEIRQITGAPNGPQPELAGEISDNNTGQNPK